MNEYLMNNLCEHYGIKNLSIEEEMNQPEFAKRTRQNKMKIIDVCDNAKNLIETIEIKVRNAPELDDQVHSEIVDDIRKEVEEMYKSVEKLIYMFYEQRR